MPYVTDTHSIVWYMTDNPKLSSKAKRAFEATDENQDCIFIPCIIFFELLYLAEKGKLPVALDTFIEVVSSSENYRIEPLCLLVIEQSRNISKNDVTDPWDRLIAATAMHLRLPLITRDTSLQKIGIKTVW